jgi:hypothetical protein
MRIYPARRHRKTKPKQSQFIRIAYCVMRIAKRNFKKQSQFFGGQNNVKSILTMLYGDFGG